MLQIPFKMTWRKAVLITILCVVSVIIILLIVTLCCCFRKFRKKSKNKKPNTTGMVRTNPKYISSQSSENPTFVLGDDEPKQINGQRWNVSNNFASTNSTSSVFAGQQVKVYASVYDQPNQSGVSSGIIGHYREIQGAVGGREATGNEPIDGEDVRFEIEGKFTSDDEPDKKSFSVIELKQMEEQTLIITEKN